MAHIVIVGAGTGGMPAAYEMRHALDRVHRITMVNALADFQFVPSNPWVAVGWRDREAVSFPIRPHLEKKGIDFVAQRVQRIDAEGNALELADGTRLDYDYLVLATGPKLAFDEVPGAGPEANTLSICTFDHANDAWGRYQKFLEQPGPAIIGAMPGASCFGPAYEFAFIFNKDLQRRKLRHKVPLTFVTSEPYIGHLGLGGVGDSKSMLESELRSIDAKWITNAKVTKVEPGQMFVTEFDDAGQPKKEHELPFAYSMMLPAFKGVDAVAQVVGREVRDTDLIGKTDKGTLSLVLLDADFDSSTRVIDRLVSRIDSYEFQTPLRISLGAACYPTHAVDADSLKQQAVSRPVVSWRGGPSAQRTPSSRNEG